MRPCATLPLRGTAAWAGGDRVKAHYLSNREAKVARQYAAGLITKQAAIDAMEDVLDTLDTGALEEISGA